MEGFKMREAKRVILVATVLLLMVCLLGACATMTPTEQKANQVKETVYFKPEKTTASYEEAGKWWGNRHWNNKLKAGEFDKEFIGELINSNTLNFFWVHSDLKDAFKKGYRFGYQDRTADLVLGPHLSEAAAQIGKNTAQKFVEVINDLEKGWAETLSKAIDVFITLISEGSQADRENFIKKFTDEYANKYNESQEKLKSGGLVTQISEGGTTLFIDARKTLAVLNIPSPSVLKTEIYRQTFRVMGDEWGRRLSHNLIKREELVDLLRRSKTALQEIVGGISGNLAIIQEAFVSSYGTDGEDVFKQLIKESGLPELSSPLPKKK